MIHDQPESDAEATTATLWEEHVVILVARAVLGCAAATLAVVASMNPRSIALWGFNQAVPHLAEMLLTLLLACAAVVGSVSWVSKALRREASRQVEGGNWPPEQHAHE
jgi:dethiobiotin synthetase